MFEVYSRAGLAGCLLFAGLGAAQAQQASAAPSAASSSGCSGFLCMFSSHREAAPAAVPSAAPPPSPTPSAAVAAAEDPPEARKVARPHRSARPITIAAAPSELDRMKAMEAALPKGKLRLVEPRSARSADLVVLAALDPTPAGPAVKLFTEQLHVVAGGAAKSLSDLGGKVVSFGPEGSPTQAAARKAFGALGITVRETPLEFDNAFDGLATGDIDAVVLLAPEPSERLNALRAPGLHLISWPEGSPAPGGAVVSSIKAGEYPHLAGGSEPVRALGIDAVLAPRGTAMQPNVRRFLASLAQHSAELSRRGFDLLRADLSDRASRQVASAERR